MDVWTYQKQRLVDVDTYWSFYKDRRLNVFKFVFQWQLLICVQMATFEFVFKLLLLATFGPLSDVFMYICLIDGNEIKYDL